MTLCRHKFVEKLREYGGCSFMDDFGYPKLYPKSDETYPNHPCVGCILYGKCYDGITVEEQIKIAEQLVKGEENE